MSLVQPLGAEEAPLPAKPYYADGDPGPIVGALAHVPELLERAMPFLGMIFGESALPLRTKEIVVLRASARLECRFCTDTHTVVARDAGLAPQEVAALRGEAPLEAFEHPRERALIAWVDAVAPGPGVPTPEDSGAIAQQFSEAEIVELTMLAGATMMLSRLATSLGLPRSEDTVRRLDEEGFRAFAAPSKGAA